jgi:hypothetical protein
MSFRTACAVLLLVIAAPAHAFADDERKPADRKSEDTAKDGEKEDGAEDSVFVQATSGDKTPRKAAYTNEDLEQKPGQTTYTNEDLEKRFGPPPERNAEAANSSEEGGSGSVVRPPRRPLRARSEASKEEGAAEAQPSDDPMAWIEQQKQEAAKSQERRAELETKVAQARKLVADLEQTRLRVSNPLLGLAPQAPAGETDWDALDNKQRLARTNERLAEAREALAKAEAALASGAESEPESESGSE